ncbi:MAG: Acyl-phosphate:glycerol-3-phosphate O-acyltransferase PlsY [Clostridiales bacterium 38_11]|nr:MAG: Acyl-phosphate:glycerol-3-phosphate O-acyltransferase PlsY [Clostridiales bacterium 38_11]
MRLIIVAIIGYMIGNISNAYLIGRIFLKKDVRNYGSGNAGATNAIRAFGAKVGIAVFLLDFLKGAIAVYIGNRMNPELGGYVAGISAIAGHNWPVTLKFKGGKGIATSIGVMLMINPLIALICFSVGLTIVIITRTVSIGSLIGVAIAPIIILFFKPIDYSLLLFTLILSSMAVFRHKANIVRLIKRQENKL